MEQKTWKTWLLNKGMEENDLQFVVPYVVSAQVVAADEEDYLRVASAFEGQEDIVFSSAGIKKEDLFEAAPSMVVDGKPRMLHLTAFIAHEGFNNNRDGFVADELKHVVENKNLFKGAYAGILDHNHDLMPIGYWYDAEYAFDQQANKYGILAHGAVWAWRFRGVSDMLLAEQVREGKVPVSMAALTKEVEKVAMPSTGQFGSILHNPVFVATSILTEAPPGDFYGRSIIEDEAKKTSNEERSKMVAKVAAGDPNTTMEEILMDKEELINALNQALGKSDETVVTKVTDFIEAKLTEVRQEVSNKQGELDTATQKISELDGQIATLTSASEEKELAFASLKDEKDALETRNAELETELGTYREEEAARKSAELREARLAQLSEFVKANLDEMDEEKKEAIVSRWATLSDDDWAARVEELNLAASKGGDNETPVHTGVLPNVVPGKKIDSLDRFLK